MIGQWSRGIVVASAIVLGIGAFGGIAWANPLVPAAGIVVYDDGNGVADTDNDTWVYQREQTGIPYLVIRYAIEEGHHVAYVYDDMNRDGRVHYEVRGDQIHLTEPHWRLRVTAREPGVGWRQANGRPNWNLDVEAASAYQLEGTDADVGLLDAAPTTQHSGGDLSGKSWISIRIWDTDQDGIPDIELDNVSLEGLGKDAVIVNENPRLPLTPDRNFPLLNTLIQVNPDEAHIRALSHEKFIPTRTNEQGYFIYFHRDEADLTSPTEPRFGWENPFAYYDLVGTHPGWPSLAIRMVSDVAAKGTGYYNEARYTWTDHTHGADYRVLLIGAHPYNQVNAYPFFPIAHVPWKDLPEWVMSRSWLGALFAEDEVGRYRNQLGEDVYSNGEWETFVRDRLLHHNLDVTVPPYLPANLGIREEYSLQFNRQPRVYVDPVDYRLHLYGATHGIVIYSAPRSAGPGGADFTIEQLRSGRAPTSSRVEYDDVDGDGYVDQWLWFKDDVLSAGLYRAGGQLVYSDASGTFLKPLPPADATAPVPVPPPRTSDEWRALHRALQPLTETRRRLDDLRAIFDAVPGAPHVLSGGRVSAFHPTARGFDLIVDLVDASALPPWLTWSGPGQPKGGGRFRLSYNSTFTLSAPSPPRLEADPTGIGLTGDSPTQGEREEVTLLLRNSGDEDALDATIALFDQDEARVDSPHRVDVPAHEAVPIKLSWTPRVPGRHQLAMALALDENRWRTLATREVEVRPASPPSAQSVFASSTDTSLALLIGMILTIVALAGGLLVLATGRGGPGSWRAKVMAALPPGLLVMGIALGMHLYWLLRYSHWIEWDTAYTTWTITSVLQSGQLIPSWGTVYPNGFAYQTFATALVSWTGFDVRYVEVVLSPVLGVIPAALVYWLYREFLGSRLGAGLASLLVFLQADFLFITSRGSHEKYSVALLAILTLALLRVYTGTRQIADVARWLAVFYVAAFALLSTNSLFATSFLATLAVAAAVAVGYESHYSWPPARTFRPLMYTLLACLLIAFLVVFYLYEPTRQILRLAVTMAERVALLFQTGERPTNPYALAGNAWVWPYTWIALRGFDLLLAGMSLLGALETWRSQVWRAQPKYALLLVFYVALWAQLIGAVVIDLTGTQGISNIQVRLFPALTILAAPFAARWLQLRLVDTTNHSARLRRVATLAACPLLVVAALAKATNEPLLSNQWTFYGGDENQALSWIYDNPGPWQTWQWRISADVDARLVDTYFLNYQSQSNQLVPIGGENEFGSSFDYTLRTSRTDARARRSGVGVPDVSASNLIYDNGASRLYDVRRRPYDESSVAATRSDALASQATSRPASREAARERSSEQTGASGAPAKDRS